LAAIFELLVLAFPPLSGRQSLRGGALSFVEDVAEHVVGDIGHADFDPRSADSDCPDEEFHLVLLPSEDVLDGRPDL